MFLIVGANSQIGAAVADALAADHHPVSVTTRRTGAAPANTLPLDLDALPPGWKPPRQTRAACIAAAVTRLSDCEQDPAGSARINCTGTIELVRRLTEYGVYTLLLSTNQVFDGTTPHVAPDEPTRPVSAYGRQKAQTEAELRAMISDGAPIGILRLSKVASPGLKLLADWRARLAARQAIHPYTDMVLSPVPLRLVVDAIRTMMRDQIAGVAQLSGPRDVTYHDIGRHLAHLVGADPALVSTARAADARLPPGAAPAHTTLDSRFLRSTYGIAVPAALDVITELLESLPQ